MTRARPDAGRRAGTLSRLASSPLLLLLLGVMGAGCAAFAGLRVERDARQVEGLRLEGAVTAHLGLIRDHLNARETLARAVAAVFRPPDRIASGALAEIDPGLLSLVPEVTSFVWVPRVEPEQQPALLAALAEAGVPRPAVLGPGRQPLPPEALRRTLFPVLEIEPRGEGNHQTLGLDLASLPLPRAALDAAALRRDAAATAPLELVQLPGVKALVLYVPVAGRGRNPDPLIGYLGFSYRYDRLFGTALTKAGKPGLGFALRDAAAPEAGELLRAGPDRPPELAPLLREVSFGGRPWRIEYWPAADPAAAARLRGVGAAGLVAAVFALVFLLVAHLAGSGRQLAAALAARRAGEERLRLAQEAGGIGVWDWDVARDEVAWSGAVYRAVGIDPATLRNSVDGFFRAVHPEDRERLRAALRAALPPGRPPFTAEFRILTPEGAVRWLAGRGEVTERDPATGRARRMIGTNVDVTERREAAAALERANAELEARIAERTRALADSEARFRAWFDGAEDAVFVLQVEPDGGFVYEAYNPAAERLTGIAASQVVGRRHEAAMPPEVAGAIRATYEAVVRSGQPSRYEIRLAFPAGERTYDTWLVPLRDPETGRIARLLGAARDVTERRELEAQVAQARKMEAIGQLTGGVAHDFNNLLMAVLGSLGLLRKRLPEGDERARRLLENAVQGAERGAALTRRMLAFARRQELRPGAVDLAGLVAGLEEMLCRSLGPTVRIEVAIPSGLPPARVDANQLELALLNLAVNARDAMPTGGTLRISAASLAVAEGAPENGGGLGLRPGRYLRLMVADTGLGMDAATLARAAEPFFTTKGPGKGTGLGLPMVHGLAAQSGGALRLRSAPGEGTTAELWLPEAEAAAAPPPAKVARLPPGGGRALRILLVDDDPLVLDGTRAMLEDLGHLVIAALPAAEPALALLRGEAPVDLLLTDHAMPGMTGLELAGAARRLRPGLPVLVASGYADPAAEPAAGIIRLAKPYGQDELAAALERPGIGLGPGGADPKVVPLPRARAPR